MGYLQTYSMSLKSPTFVLCTLFQVSNKNKHHKNPLTLKTCRSFLSQWTENTLLFNSICIYSKGKIYNSINIAATTLAKTFEGDINIQGNMIMYTGRRRQIRKSRLDSGHWAVKMWQDNWEVTLKVHQDLWYLNSFLIALLRGNNTNVHNTVS